MPGIQAICHVKIRYHRNKGLLSKNGNSHDGCSSRRSIHDLLRLRRCPTGPGASNPYITWSRVKSRGDRPPLLLIHGFGASTDHWRKNIQGLQQDFQVWAIDMMGFGRSAKPEWEYSGKLWQAQLNDFINDVIGRPAVMAGNSCGGGYSALCVAANHPDSVAGLVLLNSAGPFSETTSEQGKPPQPNLVAQVIRNFDCCSPCPAGCLFQLRAPTCHHSPHPGAGLYG